MNKRYLTVAIVVSFAIPALLMAGGHSGEAEHYRSITGRDSDFFPRVFNFLIFSGLLYYLLAEPVKNFFAERREKIAKSLQEIEARFQKAKETQKSAEQKLKESKKIAEEIMKDVELEIEVLKKRFDEILQKDLESLERAYKEKIEMEERKIKREVIFTVLDENISNNDIPITSSKVIEKLAKKVA
jgi:F-type H+-transporting ATPase subunit b